MRTIQVQYSNGTYSCDIDICKEEWLEILKDTETSNNFKDALLRFYYMPGHRGSCTAVGNKMGGNPRALNILISKFGNRVQKRFKDRFEVIGVDGDPSRWIIPMNNGKRLSKDDEGSFEWELRSELAEAIKEYLYGYLVEQYKRLRSHQPLRNDEWDELYKWELISVSRGKTAFEIVRDHVAHPSKAAKGGFENLIDAVRDNKTLKYLVENKPSELNDVLNRLVDEAETLDKRLSDYKASMSALLPASGYSSKANDERTAASILTCFNPKKYTFYKYRLMYERLCLFLGEPEQKTGLCYTHYLQLLAPLAQLAANDASLQAAVKEQLTVMVKSDLLLAQDIVWMLLACGDKQRTGFIFDILFSTNKTSTDMTIKSKYEKYIQLLKANKNLILTGAPGTGKTTIAKAIAEEMEAEVGFVQFHPSYDYTDFVEGLRPLNDGNGNVGFERRDGAFKEFCKKALLAKSVDNQTMAELNESPTVWKVSLMGTGDNPVRSDCLKNGYVRIGWDGYGDVEDFDDFRDFTDGGRNVLRAFQNVMKEGDIVVSCYSASEVDAVGIVTGAYEYREEGDAYPRYRTVKWLVKGIREDILAMNGGKRFTSSTVYKTSITAEDALSIVHKYSPSASVLERDKPFIFIIDEINRGEISKIFGELFFSIDPGYRGEKGKVQTQYQNMIEDGDVFKKGFFVPDNVYIIGTMNDIDRSVESMDFAMRRRFAWAEVTAEESYQRMIAESDDFTEDDKEAIGQRMAALNAAILKPELGLGEAYQIGAAYFRKYLDYEAQGMDAAFEMLWENHLKGLLFEYLRGNQNAKSQLVELKKAYDQKAVEHEEADKDNGQ